MDMAVKENLEAFKKKLAGSSATLIAVSKTKPVEALLQAYEAGQRDFGENKVQEMAEKQTQLPSDIRWHMIGHLQSNKVKYIAPFVHLIHSVDSEKLLRAIDKEAKKAGRVIPCLLQVHIAEEETKFGLSDEETLAILQPSVLDSVPSVSIAGLMGMSTLTDNKAQIKKEFGHLKALFERIKKEVNHPRVEMKELSMGMSGDYAIAIEEGSTMIRVGSAIFGERNYVH